MLFICNTRGFSCFKTESKPSAAQFQLLSKYGHFWLQTNQDGNSQNAKPSKAPKMVKPMGDVTVGLHLVWTPPHLLITNFQSQWFVTLDLICGTERGGIGYKLEGALCGLSRNTMVGLHAATDFGNLAVGIAVCWHPETHRDGDKEKTTHTHRGHLLGKVSAATRCPQSLKWKRHHTFLQKMNSMSPRDFWTYLQTVCVYLISIHTPLHCKPTRG